MTTPLSVLQSIWRNPAETLIQNWHWKSALYSSLYRAGIFFAINSTAGLRAAIGAMLAEFLYRALFAGFYGALTQSFRHVEPRWQGMLAAIVTLVTLSHSIEFMLHWLRGTPNLAASIATSILLTVISTSFNLHAMRNGLLITGREGNSLLTDFRLLPTLFGQRQHPASLREATKFS